MPKAGNGAPSKVGIFRSGFYWLLDVDGNRMWDDPPDRDAPYGGIAGDIPITGDWTGDGYTKIGIYRSSNGEFILDNGDEMFDSGDKVYSFLSTIGGPQAGDIPVVGDWNGSGTTKVGIFRAGFEWILDYNGNGIFDQGDVVYQFGGVAGDVPVVGDWTGDGVSKVGMFRDGYFWVLDTADPAVTASTGSAPLSAFAFGGIAGDKPVVGNWFSPPATITATSGTPQSTPIETAFSQPLVATAIGYDGYGVSGTAMVFGVSTGPGPGAGWVYGAGSLKESILIGTDGSGVALNNATLQATGVVGGPYFVTVSAAFCGSYIQNLYPGCPGLARASFSLTNTPAPH